MDAGADPNRPRGDTGYTPAAAVAVRMKFMREHDRIAKMFEARGVKLPEWALKIDASADAMRVVAEAARHGGKGQPRGPSATATPPPTQSPEMAGQGAPPPRAEAPGALTPQSQAQEARTPQDSSTSQPERPPLPGQLSSLQQGAGARSPAQPPSPAPPLAAQAGHEALVMAGEVPLNVGTHDAAQQGTFDPPHSGSPLAATMQPSPSTEQQTHADDDKEDDDEEEEEEEEDDDDDDDDDESRPAASRLGAMV